MNPADFRLTEADEYPHPPGPEPNFNESTYVNAFDDISGVGGWMRLGNRVNEGRAELSVCLYLPDGRIAVRFSRPRIAHNDAFDAGGLRFDVITPMQRLDATYEGEVTIVTNPDDLRDPARLFATAPRLPCTVAWQLDTISPQHGGEPVRDDVPTMYGRDFSLGHFNQHIAASGHITIGDEHFPINGHGWRDHSWGPRWWTNIIWYRLFLAAFPDGRGFMIHRIADETGRTRRSGVLLVDGRYHEITDFDAITDWTDAKDPASVRIIVRTETGLTAEITGEILSMAPLRNRREENGQELLSRIAEGHTRFTWDGVVGYGMTEYIEQVAKDGTLAGFPL
ncbi:DUF7064 domain-containing protein [Sphingomonas sp. KC8]|uniref:DUF7064 domain-containing protein n=1 Tax=Sphingomonas sp. KC8 TaxID=1030157 RepID=UPI000248933C|nr:hypothetical protein [Sphingomonas sp. KC8]ARS25903.1 hypothetical protein KC8_01150 [Sphingomonas sp. KC8]